MKIINANNAPQAIGPYCQAVQLENGMLYLSGQLGFDLKTVTLSGDIKTETRNSLESINTILKEAGYSKNDVIKTLVLLKDINDFQQMNEIYANYFSEHKPARSAFQVGALPKGGLIEIEVIAYKAITK